jgi:hypothetical protein
VGIREEEIKEWGWRKGEIKTIPSLAPVALFLFLALSLAWGGGD